MQPEVSIIVRTYNRVDLLRRAISSTLAQTYANFEIVVVDDGSDDGTGEMVAAIADRRVRYVRTDHCGSAAAAANVGLLASQGQFIAFLDDDDEWLPDKLKVQMSVFGNAGEQTGVVYSGAWLAEGNNGARSYWPPARFKNTAGHIHKALFSQSNFIPCVTVVVRKMCFDHVGGFDESLPAAEDYDMWIRISRDYRFAYVPEALAIHHVTAGCMTSDHRRYVAARQLLLRKYDTEFMAYGRKKSADFYCRMGGLLFIAGDSLEGRQYMLSAIKRYPLDYHNTLSLLVSFLGENVYRKIRNIKIFGRRCIG